MLLYVCNMCLPPSSFINAICTSVKKYLWRCKRPNVKFSTVISEYKAGGLKARDFAGQ